MNPEQLAFFIEAVVSLGMMTGCESKGRNVNSRYAQYRWMDPLDGVEFDIVMSPDTISVCGEAAGEWYILANQTAEKFGLTVRYEEDELPQYPATTHARMLHIGAAQ